MADTRIETTSPAGFRRLGVHGQVVVSMHRQIATILGNRLGRQHARHFARPEINPSDGTIDWYSPLPGPARRLSELAPEERARVETLARQVAAEIAQLAQVLKAEGSSAELVGRMLDQALVTPDGHDCLRVIDGQPVLILWGHEPEGRAVVPLATAPPAVAAPAAPPAAPPPPAAAAAPAAEAAALAAPATRRYGWLAWLLPLLLFLLLVLVSMRACEPLPPVVVDVPGEAVAPADPLPALVEREQALRDRLAELDRLRVEALAQCEPPAPEQRAEVVPVLPEPVPVVPLPDEPPPAESPPAEPPLAEPVPAEPVPAEPPPPAAEPPAPNPLADLPPIPPRPEELAELPPPPPSAAPSAPAQGSPPNRCNPSFPPGEEPEVVVIVDGSKSMDEGYFGGQSRIDLSRQAIRRIVNGLPKPIDVALVDFTDCNNVRRDRFYSADERGALLAEVDRLTPTGRTPLARSLERAGAIASSEADATIIVVSDGEDTCGGDPCAAARAIKAAKPGVTINVVDVSGTRGRSTVQCIAQATGGRVLTPQSGADMLRMMQQATRQPDTRSCQ